MTAPALLRTVLIVDDDPDIRRIAALSLERIGGLRVVVADGAAQALEEASRLPPDLILLDVSMPGADGPATLAALRSHPPTALVPVIFFTATAGQAEVSHLYALGAIGVVLKPFDVRTLPARIRDMFGEAELE